MKKIVIYKSKTGFSQKYAEWIAQALECDAVELKDISAKNLQSYDIIIYGGGVQASMIYDMKKVKSLHAQLSSKKWVLFADGMTPAETQGNYENLVKTNLSGGLEDIPFFYFQSGLNYEKMGFVSRKMLNMVGGMLAKKEDKTEEEAELARKFGSSSDEADVKYIEPLVACVRQFEAAY